MNVTGVGADVEAAGQDTTPHPNRAARIADTTVAANVVAGAFSAGGVYLLARQRIAFYLPLLGCLAQVAIIAAACCWPPKPVRSAENTSPATTLAPKAPRRRSPRRPIRGRRTLPPPQPRSAESTETTAPDRSPVQPKPMD
jgi:hypothetical protein